MTAVFRDYAKAGPGDDAVAASRAGAAGARAEAGAEPATWDGELWGRLSDLGLARLTGSEPSGGSGAGWIEAAELLRAAASHAVRVPVAEHDLLACWLLERAGLPAGDARRTACLVGADGRAPSVPWPARPSASWWSPRAATATSPPTWTRRTWTSHRALTWPASRVMTWRCGSLTSPGTRLALAWRSEYGSVHYWDEQVTAAAVAAGGPGLWPLITG